MTVIKSGTRVRMKVYGGESELVVVEFSSTHINVCTPTEYDNSNKLNIPPKLVGFRREFILEFLG